MPPKNSNQVSRKQQGKSFLHHEERDDPIVAMSISMSSGKLGTQVTRAAAMQCSLAINDPSMKYIAQSGKHTQQLATGVFNASRDLGVNLACLGIKDPETAGRITGYVAHQAAKGAAKYVNDVFARSNAIDSNPSTSK